MAVDRSQRLGERAVKRDERGLAVAFGASGSGAKARSTVSAAAATPKAPIASADPLS